MTIDPEGLERIILNIQIPGQYGEMQFTASLIFLKDFFTAFESSMALRLVSRTCNATHGLFGWFDRQGAGQTRIASSQPYALVI